MFTTNNFEDLLSMFPPDDEATLQEQGLTQAIGQEPESDELRLIYADWLDDHNQPERAAFIRAQIELALLPEVDPRYPELKHRCQSLLDKYREEWSEPFKPWKARPTFERGLASSLSVHVRDLVRRTDEVMKLAPIQKLSLQGVKSYLSPLIKRVPQLSAITSLDLSDNHLNASRFAKLFEPWKGRRLKHLTLGRYTYDYRMENWVHTLRDLKLTSFSLSNASHYYGVVEALASNGVFQTAQHLDLSGTWINAELLHLGRQAPALQSLDLSHTRGLGLTIPLSMIHSHAFPYLRALKLDNLSPDSVEQVQELALTLNLPALRKLSIQSWTRTGPVPEWWDEAPDLCIDRLNALIHSPMIERLTHLDLSKNQLSTEMIDLLASANETCNLLCLRLADCGLRAEQMEILAGSAHLSKLRILDLRGNPIGENGARELIESPHFNDLHTIYVDRKVNLTRRARKDLEARFGSFSLQS